MKNSGKIHYTLPEIQSKHKLREKILKMGLDGSYDLY